MRGGMVEGWFRSGRDSDGFADIPFSPELVDVTPEPRDLLPLGLLLAVAQKGLRGSKRHANALRTRA